MLTRAMSEPANASRLRSSAPAARLAVRSVSWLSPCFAARR
jgi:hypothetical protein